MDSLFGLEVFFGGGRDSKASSPRSAGGEYSESAEVEAYEENRINGQVMGYMSGPDDATALPSASELGNLPGGGRYDSLLQPGHSAELLHKMAGIFRNDPPVNCGANAQLVGLSCNYGAAYASEVFSPAAVARVLQYARDFWDPLPRGNVQRVAVSAGSQLIICGDTHGQLEDVLWVFFKYGWPSATNQYLFNGDIVDRGGHALEILLLLLAIKRDVPSAIHMQRGNHEDVQCSLHFGFRAEMQNKFNQHGGLLWNLCGNFVFPWMPLVTVVDGVLTGRRKFCVIHGGVPVDCQGQVGPVGIDGEISQIDRKRQTVQVMQDKLSQIMFNMLWADPADSLEGKRANSHGRGNRFLYEDTMAFVEKNNLAFVVRSHEVPWNRRGAVSGHQSKCFTVFSASNYMGSTGNKGGVFLCEVGKGLALKEHYAPGWSDIARLYAQHQRTHGAERLAIAEEFERDGVSSADTPGGGSPGGSRRPKPSLPAPVTANREAQTVQFFMERICEHKDQLFFSFRNHDPNLAGLVSKARWKEVLHCTLSVDAPPEIMSPATFERLHASWNLGDPVGYVRFLHRFQIRGPDEAVRVPDLLREVSKLRRQLLDAPSHGLERLLDPNGDRSVSQQEFTHFLPMFNLDVPPLHAGTLYQTMTGFCGQDPLTLDDTVLCLSIMSRDPPPVNQWSPLAERIGQDISQYGLTYAGAFRHWDTDSDGFLQLGELQQGLQHFPATKHIDRNSIEDFMCYIEGMGMANRRVSMFEFVRAIAPRSLALELHASMLKELLKRVWLCRPLLLSLLAKFDPRATNSVAVSDFKACLGEVNHMLERAGRPMLSDAQINSITELAASGTRSVYYDRFIKGLHVIDLGSAC
uniref:EF-hand domain-containing protein n=1 Tax=Zooxanthella nutricula TaxID=1333877 RepID=A0A7S2M0Y0_9DINO|mmetsp:Transcript_6986/g.20786  ORF Transcript_6986/g.20786 Transcript_6986/m.20786 type:complete len:861 (+) Transcript_6986:86-2668(+)